MEMEREGRQAAGAGDIVRPFAGLATAGQNNNRAGAEAGNGRWLNEKRSKLCAKHLRIHHGDRVESS